jgi:magnesium chelatase subunit D
VTDDPAALRWADAVLAASLFAIDPVAFGGVRVRASAGPVRDRWLAYLRALLPPDAPWRRVPLHAAESRLLGGLDLAATLAAGRPVAERGLLAEADGGVVVLPMAERFAAVTAGHLCIAMDTQRVALERDGFAQALPARFGVVALDEGTMPDEQPPSGLLDRLAFDVALNEISLRVADGAMPEHSPVAGVLEHGRVVVSPALMEALCAAAVSLGIDGLRASLFAVRATRVAAALAGRREATAEDAALAARLVLAPRATRLPPDREDAREEPADTGAPRESGAAADRPEPPDGAGRTRDSALDDVVLAAAKAAMPTQLLAELALAQRVSTPRASAGATGASRLAELRGKPIGARRGDPRRGARLDVLATLRVAAPWQALRRRESAAPPVRVIVRREDFRLKRFREHTQTTAIFAVDASGSSALNRLAEAKGAVELLLAQCYVRRDRVALLAFRGRGCELLLSPTRSLVRAKRSLAGLPGGGGTPLAAGIDAAVALAEVVGRQGGTPIVVLLTDGRANVARDGTGGRARAEEEALLAARRAGSLAVTILLVDTSPKPQPQAQALAGAMHAQYLPLPYAGSAAISSAVKATMDVYAKP